MDAAEPSSSTSSTRTTTTSSAPSKNQQSRQSLKVSSSSWRFGCIAAKWSRRRSIAPTMMTTVCVIWLLLVEHHYHKYWLSSSLSYDDNRHTATDAVHSHLLSFASHPCEEGDSKCRERLMSTGQYLPKQQQQQPQQHDQKNDDDAQYWYNKLRALREGNKALPSEFPKRIVEEERWPRRDNHTCLVNNNNDDDEKKKNSSPFLAWQTRAPYVVVLGTQKGGTQALTTYLWQHPKFVQSDHETMEGHFFDGPSYQTRRNGIPQLVNQRAYAQYFEEAYAENFFDPKTGQAKPNVYALDTTPYYLIQSDIVPQGLMCVAPWARWIALLRNPITRVESHYRMWEERRRDRNQQMVDWETWIQHDIAVLKYTGVLQDKVSFPQYSGSAQEYQAWKRYLRTPLSSQKIVGRGLYAIQIQHYLDAIPKQQRPEEKLLVLLSEQLRNDTQTAYDQILDFLNLPPHTLTKTDEVHTSNKKPQANPMPKHIRQQLKDLYRPYNQRLYDMLGWTRENNPYLWDQDDDDEEDGVPLSTQ